VADTTLLCAIAPPPEHKGRMEPLPFVPALRGATVRSLRTCRHNAT